MIQRLPVRGSTPPKFGLLQCEKAPMARSGSTWDIAPLMVSKMRTWQPARPPPAAGYWALKKLPGRAVTSITRITPEFCGTSIPAKMRMPNSA